MTPIPLKVSHRLLVLTLDTTTRQPMVRVELEIGGEARQVAAIDPACPHPTLELDGQGVDTIIARDILEYVVDEEAWLEALAGVLAPGGELVVRVPMEGPLAWMDAVNFYRYVQDTTGLGVRLNETKMQGWHRHYPPAEVERLVHEAGLEITSVSRSGSPHLNIVHFSELAWGKLIRPREGTERRARRRRADAESGPGLPHLGPFSTSVTVRARKP